MNISRYVSNLINNADAARDASRVKNLSVVATLLGPAVRGLMLQQGKQSETTHMPASHAAAFTWAYRQDQPEMAKLYAAAKVSQWDPDKVLDWKTSVDFHDPDRSLMEDSLLPLSELPAHQALNKHKRAEHRAALVAWMLSQFLHGEQGALYAACQVTESVGWFDGKLYGATQVMDEGRHVEVFNRYLQEKMGRVYAINDNLFVIIDALMRGSDWDLKFLGMQIMIEGLALGAFGSMRAGAREPLLRELLKYVITDEARHVTYGVVALREHYSKGVSEKVRRDREDWAFEMALLLRNRFLAHEFYEEYYAQSLTRKEWDAFILNSKFMKLFRSTMFRRIVPNLKRIGLMSERIRPHYQAIGLLDWEHEKAAPDLTAQELVDVELPKAS